MTGWATVSRTLIVAALTTVLTLTAWVLLPLSWGWDAYTVTSGSMAPLVRPGDVVIASPGAGSGPRPGTVVVLAPAVSGGEPVTHRVVERLPDGRYRTQGDANAQPDSRLVTKAQLLGVGRIVVPLAGTVRLHAGRAAPVAGLVLIALSLAIPQVRRRFRYAGRHRLVAVAATGVLAAAAALPGTGAVYTATSATATNSWKASYFYTAAVKASGPVSYWRMGGTSPSPVADETGTTPLTLYNSPTTGVAGAVRADPNTATRFKNGTGPSYAAVTAPAHSITGPLTVAAWTDAVATTNWRLVFKGSPNAGMINYLLSWSSDGRDMRFIVDFGTTRQTALGRWPTGGGYHFAVGVYDGSALRLYLDGVQVAAQPVTGTITGYPALPLTVSENSATTGLTGSVDEVAIWNKALTATQISTLYALARQ
ncbi:signal peptidase I [Actinoplanes friuliensis]|uniref:Signal peptidase I n=1 Tax=Actinoplanes friuliensis DSM 7358 TaxID=1246995 RepID=U5VT62_9ACTN|nr:signal peptidase I [Actinoplanes friuliensis]AGZ40002.1 peptidase S26B, signal peptidase [Actinoplanes friuliensis DSM 7358]